MKKELIITLSHKVKQANGTFWKEPDTFIKVVVVDDLIKFPFGMALDYKEAANAAKELNMHLVDYLSKGIQNDLDLLKVCKKHRIGYPSHIIKEQMIQSLSRKSIGEQRDEQFLWEKFITKIRSQKEANFISKPVVKKFNKR